MIVGQRIRRPDAADKVKGTALYVEDLPAAGALPSGAMKSAALGILRVCATRSASGSSGRTGS